MKQMLLVFVGGGLGSMLRYVLSKYLNPHFQHFYLGTFAANIIGCLLIGFILGLSIKNSTFDRNQLLFLATGFCGGFTTFSTFAFEKHSLLTSGEFLHFALYLSASILIGLLAVGLGLWISRLM